MTHFAAALRDVAPIALALGFIALAAWTLTMIWHDAAEERRITEELAKAQERAERQERVNRFAAETRAAFEAQMPDRLAQVERIRQQIAENETRRFIEAWDRGEVQP